MPPRDAAVVAEALGDVCENFAAYARATSAYERVLELLPDDPVVETRLAAKRGALRERVAAYDDAVATYELGLARLEELPPETELVRNRAEIELGAAGVHFRQGRFEESLRWAELAAAHAREIDDRSRLAHAYYLIAGAHNELGHADGIAFCEQALAIYEELADFGGMGHTLNNLGDPPLLRGPLGRGRERLPAQAVRHSSGPATSSAPRRSRTTRARCSRDQGRLEEAAGPFRHFARVCKAAGYALGEGAAADNLARLDARAGRFDEAHALFADARGVFERIGAAVFALEAQAREAECFVFEGRHGEAIALLEQTAARARPDRWRSSSSGRPVTRSTRRGGRTRAGCISRRASGSPVRSAPSTKRRSRSVLSRTPTTRTPTCSRRPRRRSSASVSSTSAPCRFPEPPWRAATATLATVKRRSGKECAFT